MDDWAVVTGGSRGIGQAVCRLFADKGRRIIVMDRIRPEHDRVDEFLEVDFEQPEAAAETLRAAIGDRRVTRLVHNAGICVPASLQSLTLADVRREIEISTTSLIALGQVVVPSMKRAGIGRIVTIGSRAALGKQERTGYSAAKAAMTGIVRTWALELGRDGITANVVAPGATRTWMLQAHNEVGGWFERKMNSGIPVGFIAEPEDIAQAVAFFCSDEARFVTGQVLNVCGGTSVNFLEAEAAA